MQCRGLDAVLDYTAKLDGVTLDPSAVRVPAGELARGLHGGRPGLSPHDPPGPREHPGVPVGILNRDATLRRGPSCELRLRYRPLRRVGVCIPGGRRRIPRRS